MTDQKIKIFSSYRGPEFKQLDLIAIQLDSFKWFREQGLKELFQEISPIKDHTGHEMELHFLDYKFDPPKYTEEQTKEKLSLQSFTATVILGSRELQARKRRKTKGRG